ncbi:MAG TPA: ABC transporter ATP-binding protein [Steroidobacteraceae bacterium]|nr:ABC transporter ATP-binding protein [Steroidobacteraceae bacterium]
MAVTQPLIEVRGAAFHYGEHCVFSAMDLDIFRGEVLTILGPNGCGKSTLLRCIGGQLALSGGTVRIDHADVSSLEAGARARKIGFLFQRHLPSFPFPVLDVVSMGRAPHLSLFCVPASRDIDLAEQALAKVGVLHLKDRPYTELSGGELQLVLLARTLVQQPDVILLDEPTSHLDFRNQTLSLRTIGALAAEGVTMVMTTHDPNHAFLLPGRVLLMQPGGAILTGLASQIITDSTLSATYGIDITVFSVPRRTGAGELKFCSSW